MLMVQIESSNLVSLAMVAHASMKAQCTLRAAGCAPMLAHRSLPVPLQNLCPLQRSCKFASPIPAFKGQEHRRDFSAKAVSNGSSSSSGLKIDLTGAQPHCPRNCTTLHDWCILVSRSNYLKPVALHCLIV